MFNPASASKVHETLKIDTVSLIPETKALLFLCSDFRGHLGSG